MIQEKIIEDINLVMHPAINFSLVDLGIVKSINITETKTTVVFAFPFPNIPIAEQLINSVSEHVLSNGTQFEHEIVLMTEQEKAKFMQLETDGWKGM